MERGGEERRDPGLIQQPVTYERKFASSPKPRGCLRSIIPVEGDPKKLQYPSYPYRAKETLTFPTTSGLT